MWTWRITLSFVFVFTSPSSRTISLLLGHEIIQHLVATCGKRSYPSRASRLSNCFQGRVALVWTCCCTGRKWAIDVVLCSPWFHPNAVPLEQRAHWTSKIIDPLSIWDHNVQYRHAPLKVGNFASDGKNGRSTECGRQSKVPNAGVHT